MCYVIFYLGQVGLVFEFAPLGNLKLHLKRYEVKSGLMIDFARQIATGMKYVASQRASDLFSDFNFSEPFVSSPPSAFTAIWPPEMF